MKKTLDVQTVRDGLWMDTNITYAQVPGWRAGWVTRPGTLN